MKGEELLLEHSENKHLRLIKINKETSTKDLVNYAEVSVNTDFPDEIG